ARNGGGRCSASGATAADPPRGGVLRQRQRDRWHGGAGLVIDIEPSSWRALLLQVLDSRHEVERRAYFFRADPEDGHARLQPLLHCLTVRIDLGDDGHGVLPGRVREL